jgi:hypothetical protein
MKHNLSGQASPDISQEGISNAMAGRMLERKGGNCCLDAPTYPLMVKYWHQEVHMGKYRLSNIELENEKGSDICFIRQALI